MADRRDLSLRLYNVLEMVGASERMRSLHQRTATTSDILETFRMDVVVDHFIDVYLCGSNFEGTVTPDLASDLDEIRCVNRPLVASHRLKAGPGWFLLMVRDDWTYPGYTKLQLAWNGRPLTVNDIGVHGDWKSDLKGRACKTHFIGDNVHGPADMFVDEHGTHYHDRVQAFRCSDIPLFATEWITRHRNHGWPSQQLLDKMRFKGCLLVGVGHFNSPEKDVEWRVSFSLQERMLMKSLNPVQHKVYILLKMIKKNILEKHFDGESLSSYHCKTCVFHIAETTPAHVWVPDNLITCLRQSLELLLKWLRDKFCPSFFVKKQNLFEKEGFERLIEPLGWLIDQLLQTGHQFLYKLESDRVGEILKCGDMSLYEAISDVDLNYYEFELMYRLICNSTGTYHYMLAASKSQQDVVSFFATQLEKFQQENRYSGYTVQEIRTALCYIQPWLHLTIGVEFAARAVACQNKSHYKTLITNVDSHIQLASNASSVNVELVQAAIRFKCENYEECFLLLEDTESHWSNCILTYCLCTRQRPNLVLRDKQELLEIYPPMRNISGLELTRSYVATCVRLLPSQAELVPTPLQYEMHRSLFTTPGSRHQYKEDWFDLAVVDAKVYLYFMQYLVCSKLNRELHKQHAIENLTSLIQYQDGLGHKETAYNLLGWIHLQEHSVADAVQCLAQSWQLRPHHNAAKYLLCLVYKKQAEMQPEH